MMRPLLVVLSFLCGFACAAEGVAPAPATSQTAGSIPAPKTKSSASVEIRKASATRRGWSCEQIRTAAAALLHASYGYRYSDVDHARDAQIQGLLSAYIVSPCHATEPVIFLSTTKQPPLLNSHWVERLLDQLSAEQDEDGSWRQDSVTTSEAMLVFLNCGNSTKIGSFRKTLRNAQPWLLARFDAGGGFCGSTLHEHLTATNALSESYAMSENSTLIPYLERAQRIVLQRQNTDGSWGDRQELVWRDGSLCWEDDPARRLTTTALALQSLYITANCNAPAPDLTHVRERAWTFASDLLTPCGLLRKPANPNANARPAAVAAGQFILVFTKGDTDPTLQQIGALAYLMRELPAFLANHPTEGWAAQAFMDMGAFRTFSERRFMGSVMRTGEAVMMQQVQALFE